jgi:dynein heavy chain
MGDNRVKWIVDKLVACTGVEPHIADKVLNQRKSEVTEFFHKDGPEKILFYYQEKEAGNGKPELSWTTGTEPLRGKCIYFLRVNPKGVDQKTAENDMSCGEIAGPPLQAFQQSLSLFYVPALRQQEEWGEAQEPDTKGFLDLLERYQDSLTDAVNSLTGGVELRLPDLKVVDLDIKPASVQKAAGDHAIVSEFETICDSWLKEIDKLMKDIDMQKRDPNDVGPASELEYWRGRMARFNNVAEQLKKKECKFVIATLAAAKSSHSTLWKHADSGMTDALNEAKDNVKYLSTLEKYTDVLYHGTPLQVNSMFSTIRIQLSTLCSPRHECFVSLVCLDCITDMLPLF